MTFNERSVAAGRRVDFSAIQAWLRESPPIEDLDAASSSSISFVELWARIARGASAALACGLPDQPEVSVLDDLRENLTLRLSQVGEGPVWEYFNAHRPLNVLLWAHLDADERAVRRTHYCRVLEALRTDGLQGLTTEYPVLRRHLSTTVAFWLASSSRDSAAYASRSRDADADLQSSERCEISRRKSRHERST